MSQFPYGADPRKPHSFLGMFNAPSKRWLISYWGGYSLLAGYHSFIFLGLENLNIASVQLTGGGLNASWGAKKAGRTTRQEELLDLGENAVNKYDAAKDYLDLDEADDSPIELYRAMMNNSVPTLVTAMTPFSLLDVSQAWGMVEGFNADAYVAGAQIYWLTMHNNFRFLNSDRKYMARQRVANLDGGGIGAGVGNLFGKFSVERYHSLYHALGTSSNVNDRPYRTVPSIHPYIAELPPVHASLEAPEPALQRIPSLQLAR